MLQRLVPVHRGLFEDYVANFWCSTHPLVKWKRLFPQQALMRIALACTVAAFTPACLHQAARPSRLGFLYCLTNTAFAFYMFSYQVPPPAVHAPRSRRLDSWLRSCWSRAASCCPREQHCL